MAEVELLKTHMRGTSLYIFLVWYKKYTSQSFNFSKVQQEERFMELQNSTLQTQYSFCTKTMISKQGNGSMRQSKNDVQNISKNNVTEKY